MIDITSVKHLTLPRKDDVDSGPLSTGGDFKFGYETIKALYVWILLLRCMNSLIVVGGLFEKAKCGHSMLILHCQKYNLFLYRRFPVMDIFLWGLNLFLPLQASLAV